MYFSNNLSATCSEAEEDEEEEQEEGVEGSGEEPVRAAARKRKRGAAGKALPGEDDFMRIADMQSFLERAEQAAAASGDEADAGATFMCANWPH